MHVKRKLYKRIVILFCIIILVPTVILNVFYYSRMRDIIYQGITEESVQSLEFLRATADSSFFEFHKIWNNVNRDNLFLSFPDNPSTTQVIELQNMLDSQFRLSRNLYKIILVSENGDRIFSDRGCMLRSRFYDFMQENTNLDMSNMNLHHNNTIQVLYSDSNYLTLVYPLVQTTANSHRQSLILLLDLRFFLPGYLHGNDWLFLDEPHNMLVQWTQPLTREDVAEAIQQIDLYTLHSGSVSQRFSDYIINITHSNYLDLNYIRVVSLANTISDINHLNYQMLLLIFAILIVGSILFLLFIRYNYSPIKNMMSMIFESDIYANEVQSISFADEEEFMQSSLNKLIEVNKAYKNIQNAPGFEWYPADMIGELSIAINRFNIQKTEDLLNKICLDIQNQEIPLYVVKAVFFHVVYLFDSKLRESSIDLNQIYINEYNSKELTQVLYMCFEKYRESVSKKKKEEHKAEQLSAYVTAHFMDHDFSIKTFAHEFCYSVPVMSQTYKRLTGRSFQEHVNALKMQEAKRFLAENNHSIDDISQILGYSNASSFGRAFKKATGHSPREFLKTAGDATDIL